MHLIPGTLQLIFAGIGWIVAPLLFALAPADANYWAYIFPAIICATIGLDITFNITSIFITTSVSQKRQALAGALINSVIYLSISFFLGFADVTAVETAHLELRKSYQSVFWYEVACAAVALIVMVGFVRINNARSEMTADEKEEVQVENTTITGNFMER